MCVYIYMYIYIYIYAYTYKKCYFIFPVTRLSTGLKKLVKWLWRDLERFLKIIFVLFVCLILKLSIFWRALRCPPVVSHRLPDNFPKFRVFLPFGISSSSVIIHHHHHLASIIIFHNQRAFIKLFHHHPSYGPRRVFGGSKMSLQIIIFFVFNAIKYLFQYSHRVRHVILLWVAHLNSQNGPWGAFWADVHAFVSPQSHRYH